jgi:integrase
MTYTFFLAHPEKESSAILIGLRDGTKRKTVSTGITIKVENWDKENKTIKRRSDDGAYAGKLALIERGVSKEVKEANVMEYTLVELYNNVLKLMGRAEEKEDTSEYFLPFYQYWATNSFDRHNASKFTLLSYRIMDSYITDKRIKFKDVDYNFYIKFLKWLKEDKGYSINMQGTQIKNLKAVLNESFKRKLHNNRDYMNFIKPSENVDNVYLSIEEYDKIYNLELKGIKKTARDLFLIGCYTALRVSDYSRLTPNDIRDGFIYLEQKKTKGKVVIPVHKRVAEVIEAYGGSPKLSEQKLNQYIKEVCKMAGITELIGVKENGKYVYKEKYQLVSSHTARRSAATNMALNGTPLRDIMQITGHTTESSLLKYIKITNEQNARRLASNPFFL